MNLVAHVEIPVRDLERAMNFYSAVFDISLSEIVELHGNRMAWFPFTPGEDGASGALAEGEVYVPTTNGAIIYFSVADIDAALSRAIELGSTVVFPKTAIGDTAHVAEITDPEGNRIALQTI